MGMSQIQIAWFSDVVDEDRWFEAERYRHLRCTTKTKPNWVGTVVPPLTRRFFALTSIALYSTPSDSKKVSDLSVDSRENLVICYSLCPEVIAHSQFEVSMKKHHLIVHILPRIYS